MKPDRHEVITKHILENNRTHDLDWDNVEILHTESNFYKRAFAERVYIRKQGPNAINSNSDCNKLPKGYNVILKSI